MNLTSILSNLFQLFTPISGCHHKNTSWPRQKPNGKGYVVCHDCATELPYNGPLIQTRAQRRRYQQKIDEAREALAAHQLPDHVAEMVGRTRTPVSVLRMRSAR